MSLFTLDNALAQAKKPGDLFKPVLGKGINMEKVLKAIT
jgi:bifunctional non-homologous end joining protein LigD